MVAFFKAWKPRLCANRIHLARKIVYLESPDLHAVIFDHQHDVPAARSA